MQFKAVEPKIPLLIISVMTFLVFLTADLLIFLFLAIICIISINIKYQFEVNENDLSFTTTLFGLNLLNRKASKENIKFIEFKRINGYKKAVFIQLEKGFKWKILRFQPSNFDEYIERYATTNSIEIKKHKNY